MVTSSLGKLKDMMWCEYSYNGLSDIQILRSPKS